MTDLDDKILGILDDNIWFVQRGCDWEYEDHREKAVEQLKSLFESIVKSKCERQRELCAERVKKDASGGEVMRICVLTTKLATEEDSDGTL